MRERKYHLYITPDEYSIIVKSLIDLKNSLIQQGVYTDGVDDLLIKISKAKKRKLKPHKVTQPLQFSNSVAVVIYY